LDDHHYTLANESRSITALINTAAKGAQIEFPYPFSRITRASALWLTSSMRGSPQGTTPRGSPVTSGKEPGSTRRTLPSRKAMMS
jgi:hypothetical protein